MPSLPLMNWRTAEILALQDTTPDLHFILLIINTKCVYHSFEKHCDIATVHIHRNSYQNPHKLQKVYMFTLKDKLTCNFTIGVSWFIFRFNLLLKC